MGRCTPSRLAPLCACESEGILFHAKSTPTHRHHDLSMCPCPATEGPPPVFSCHRVHALLGFLLSLAVGAAYLFVFPLIWEKRFSAAKAIQESFHLFKENWLHLTLFYVVGSIIGGVGVLLFGIGIILTFPIYLYATACLYRDWIGFDETNC